MRYDFDEVIERRNMGSSKYDTALDYGMPEDSMPFWVADMDFKSPQPVIDAIHQRVNHGIYGYGIPVPTYKESVKKWYQERFHWNVKEEWLVATPGIVFAVNMAVRAFTAEGEGVLIQQPVYYPFGQAICNNNRRLVNSPLVYRDGSYSVDMEQLEQTIAAEKPKLFILCSPHNPVGRVWTKAELEGMGDLCVRYGITVVSDEIHADFVWPGHQQTVFASIKPEFEAISITCTAPSKTFNLAGLQTSNIFIANEELRRAFRKEITKTGYMDPNILGLAACQAAYETGGEWLEQLKEYLLGNISAVREFLADNLPGVRLIEPEGTYLLWLDFNGLGLTRDELQKKIVTEAKLWFDTGTMFGSEGEGFERINAACPRAVLMEGLRKLAAAFK